MLLLGGSWCHRCCLHSSSLCFGDGGFIGSVGRECCSVKVHYSSHYAPRPQLQPCMAPGLTQEASPSAAIAAIIFHQRHLALSSLLQVYQSSLLFLFFFLSRPVLTQTDSINPTCDLCSTPTSRGTRKMKTCLFLSFI